MKKKIKMKESVVKAFEEEFKESVKELSEDEVIEKARSSKKFNLRFNENGTVEIRQVLMG